MKNKLSKIPLFPNGENRMTYGDSKKYNNYMSFEFLMKKSIHGEAIYIGSGKYTDYFLLKKSDIHFLAIEFHKHRYPLLNHTYDYYEDNLAREKIKKLLLLK
jgi:hypothetical protein